MTISDWLVIVAILLAPLIAVQVQKYIEISQEKRNRKLSLFKTLMRTRGFPLNPQHVEALNMIDIEFHKNQKIVDKWKILLDTYANYPKDPKDPNYQSRLDSCAKEANDQHVDLLFEMGQSLNYTFDKVHLKRGMYMPKGHTDIIIEQEFIRRSLVSMFLNQLAIPIRIVESQSVGGNEKKQ